MKQVLDCNIFKKDLKICAKRGYDKSKLIRILDMLAHGETLPDKNRLHHLIGRYIGCRECHIAPDWLLIFRETDDAIYLVRTGSHADLFD